MMIHKVNHCPGFSLLELISVIFILGLLLCFAVPQFNQFLMRQERDLVFHQLNTAIEYAKQEAILRGKTVTLCASSDKKTCTLHNWTEGFVALIDFDRTQSKQTFKPEQILRVFRGVQYGQLHFEQWEKHLNIQANGMTHNVGTFTYCPKNKDRREAEGLTINKACRTYRPIERNHLGIRLKKEGTPEAEPLTCR